MSRGRSAGGPESSRQFWPAAECSTEADLESNPQRDPSRDELDQWVRATLPSALAYAVSLVQDQAAAEDIVHDCYGRLLERSGHYDLPRDGRKLLFKSVTNACINWTTRRRAVVELHPESASIPQEHTAPEQSLMAQELEQAIADALAELDVQQRAIIELQALGHSLVEVAEMLELTHSNTRVLLHRARQQLAKRLEPFLEETR